MLTFYEMLQLIEGADEYLLKPKQIDQGDAKRNASAQFSADQLGYTSGDNGEKYVGPIQPKHAIKTIQGTADAMEKSRGKLVKRGSRGYGRDHATDIGKKYDLPRVGASNHWGDRTASAEDGHLSADDYDVTGQGGKTDVSHLPNATKQSSPITSMKQGSQRLSGDWEEFLNMKKDQLLQSLNFGPQKDQVKEFLAKTREKKNLTKDDAQLDKIAAIEDEIYTAVEKDERSHGIPAQDSPRKSPMTKYMLRKHSRKF